MSKPLEDYGLIGNMISAALVASDGSIDWLCLPRFDSPACFAALLGKPENGRWIIAPRDKVRRTTRRYLPCTAVLETRFETATGAVTVIDFMPLTDNEEKVDLVRMVRGERGEVVMETELALRFNYGRVMPWVRRRDYGLSAVAGPHAIEMHTPIILKGRNMVSHAEFTVRKGDTIPFTLSYHSSHKEPHFVPDRAESLRNTVTWWHEWTRNCTFPEYDPGWRDAVIRSLITLKLLTYAPTGGIIAAPTTSLPEAIGGARNWDYRYCWLRDSALTLGALVKSGYRSEAEAWRQWMLRAVAGHPRQLRIMYGAAGERWLPENEVHWLEGYESSKPVRVGNGAADQLQLDVFGEIANTLHLALVAGLPPSENAVQMQSVALEYLETIWSRPDNGIWEVRGPKRDFTHSRMMCWVAFDRIIKTAEIIGHDGSVARWRKLRDKIHAEICAKGFDEKRNTFTQYYGGETLDASLLLMPRVGFLKPQDPRVLGTIKAIENHLLQDGFVQRYSTEHVDDGVGGEEGAFLACSFWLADAYVLTGQRKAALDMFERLMSLRNDLGLLSEEYDAKGRRLIGNFPQAFSHLGLINTAHFLAEAHIRERSKEKGRRKPAAKGKTKRARATA